MSEDKYHPIPGDMDTIDCLRKERDELKKVIDRQAEEIKELVEFLKVVDSVCFLSPREHFGLDALLAKHTKSESNEAGR